MKTIRTLMLATMATLPLAGMASGGANAAESPVIHDSGTQGTASVIHVAGTNTVPQTIHGTFAKGGALLGFGN